MPGKGNGGWGGLGDIVQLWIAVLLQACEVLTRFNGKGNNKFTLI